MAVSGNTQAGMWGDHANGPWLNFKTRAEAEAAADELRATGDYRRVEVRMWNNGTATTRIMNFKVNAWRKR